MILVRYWLMKRFIGDKEFYKHVFMLVIPIMIQQGITSVVNLLDNIMVGVLGQEAISSVSISNQIITISQLAVFGGLSAISIYSAQFYGGCDYEGMRYAFRSKIVLGAIIAAATIVILLNFGSTFTGLFLKGDANGGDITLTLSYAESYIKVILVGLVPFTLSQAYAGTLRETGQTFIPMVASVAAILTNLCFNWLLIYGHLGFPKWGVFGAAVATSLSRYLEFAILVIYTHAHSRKYAFIQGAFRSLYVPSALIKKMFITGVPLFMNEFLWSFGMTTISQSYSVKGFDVVSATTIAATTWNIFMVFMVAMGSAVQIIVGQQLGMGEIEKAKDTDAKLLVLNLLLNATVGVLLIIVSPYVPLLFNVSGEIREMARLMLIINGAVLPIEATVHSIYFTIRSGGKTFITFLFDSVYTWIVPLPLAFFLCRFTSMGIVPIYGIVQFSATIKMIIGLFMLKRGTWAEKII